MSSHPQPSQVSNVYWLYAERGCGAYPRHTPRGGKWLLFVSVTEVDEAWATIRAATEQGRLGGASKVATAKPSPLAKHPDLRVICVYTYDWTDQTDVLRVRQELRELGFTSKIAYKADEDTRAGRYAGQGRVAKYLE
jgi:hypothetical protein